MMLLSKAVPFFLIFTRSLLLAVLFLPLLPAFLALVLYALGAAMGCEVTTGSPCMIAGVDIASAYTHTAQTVNAMAQASASMLLLYYIILLAALAQLTIGGFRGRVVRTCFVVMWAGVLPLVLGLAATATGGYAPRCEASADLTPSMLANACENMSTLTSFIFYANVFSDWLADIAVPLAVMVSGLLAITLGYLALIKRFVLFATHRG